MMASSTKTGAIGHTKGPWHRDGHNLAAVIHCTAEKGSPEANHICGDYETVARCEGDNWEANARLIAAAPDLIEALTQCQKALAMMITPTQIEQTSALQAFAIATEAETKARAAIAKAEGRS